MYTYIFIDFDVGVYLGIFPEPHSDPYPYTYPDIHLDLFLHLYVDRDLDLELDLDLDTKVISYRSYAESHASKREASQEIFRMAKRRRNLTDVDKVLSTFKWKLKMSHAFVFLSYFKAF